MAGRWHCDQTSAFGGILALQPALWTRADGDVKSSRSSPKSSLHPDASDEAKEILSAKKNLRLMITGEPRRSASARV
jgi:phosphoribosylaminoimidazolecarboxamide formyltransferase/IMP cyclohydrolase